MFALAHSRLKLLPLVFGLALPFLGQAAYGQYDPVLAPENERSANPVNMVGQMQFFSGRHQYVGSGTAVTQRGVVTAAHNLYDRRHGFSRSVIFSRGRNGNQWLVRTPITRQQILPGYSSVTQSTSDRAFALDVGVIHTLNVLASGATPARVYADPRLLQTTQQKTMLGYGAERHSGRHLLRSTISDPFFIYRGPFLGNDGFEPEAGMSGGPVFLEINGVLTLTAVIVSSGGGVRALDASARPLLNSLR